MPRPPHSGAQYIPPDHFNYAYKTAIGFWPNDGQVVGTDGQLASTVRFVSDGSFPKVYLHEKSLSSFVLRTSTLSMHDTLRRFDMLPVGSNANQSDPIATVLKNVTHRYHLPHCPAGVEVPGYNRIIYENMYDGIDFHYYGASAGQKLAIVCHPGSDPQQIKLKFTGQDSLGLDIYGFLKLHYDGRYLKLPYALAYQVDANNASILLNWGATYNPDYNAGEVSFFYQTYDPTKPLVLLIGSLPMGGAGGGEEPQPTWSTLPGTGNGTGSSEFISAGDADSDGDLYVAGNTRDQAFPISTGTTFHQGNVDVVFGRTIYAPGDADLDARVDYMVFFGGSGDEKATVIHNSTNGEDEVTYIGGWTNSAAFPILPLIDLNDGGYRQSNKKGNNDGFILKVDAISGFVSRSTYFGGEGTEMITAVTEDSEGNLYFGGATSSTTGSYGQNCSSPASGFPLCSTESADYQQTANAGGTDGFVLRLNPTFQLTWSSFYGGIGDDHIYDAGYMRAPVTSSGPTDRIAIVGSSTSALPFGANGTFQITSNSEQSGFISTWDPDRRSQWGTFLPGVIRLEAVVADKTSLVVMGLTKLQANTQLTCDEVADGLPICNPGGSAYQDATINRHDAYFAEFLQPSGALKWSTAYGDLGWLGAIFPDNNAGPDHYSAQEIHPFPIYRFSDLECDNNSSIYAMGLFQHGYWEIDDDQSTLPAFGFYNQAWEPQTGSNQTDLSLFLFDLSRELKWASLFGGGFDHVDSDPDPLPFDVLWYYKGCEFGHDLVLVPGEALYWVGTAGGVALPEACPYPNVSWCEASLEFVGDNLDPLQGFATRMNLNGLFIGMDDHSAAAGSVLTCLPDPTPGSISFRSNSGPVSNALYRITNALGQLVLTGVLDEQGAVDVSALPSGPYAVELQTLRAQAMNVVRFVRQ